MVRHGVIKVKEISNTPTHPAQAQLFTIYTIIHASRVHNCRYGLHLNLKIIGLKMLT
jgi:hypothetical protein